MAEARKLCSYTEGIPSNNSRSLPTQPQSPRIVRPSKSLRGVRKKKNIVLKYDPAWAPREQLDQPSHIDWYNCELSYDSNHGDLAGRYELPPDWWPDGPGYERDPREQLGQLSHNDCFTCDRSYDSNHGDLAGRHELPPDWLPDWSVYGKAIAEVPFTISPAACLPEIDFDTEAGPLFPPETRATYTYRKQLTVEVKAMLEAEFFGWNVGIYQPTNDQHSVKEHRKKWSKYLRFCYNEAASKGAFTRRPDNQIHTLFFLKKMSYPGPCGSTSSAEIGGSNLLSQSVSDKIIAPNEVGVFGRNSIGRWKDGPGRSKDWRSSRSLKSMRKGQRAKFQLSSLKRRSCLNPSKATNCYLAITHLTPHIAVPKDMLKQKSTSCQDRSSCLKPRSTWHAMNEVGLNKKTNFLVKSSARCEPWMTDPIDSLDSEESWRSEDRFNADLEVSSASIDDLLNAMVSTHTEMPSPIFETPNAKSISLNHLLAPESFVDTILGACLRLKRLLRTESHFDVYDAEYLSDNNQKYEVRAYNLRGLSPNLRNYRIRNLKRASARSSYIDTLEQGGKKWLVFAEDGADLVPEPSRNCQPLWCTEEEYDLALPVLEPRKPHNTERPEKEALKDAVTLEAYDTSFEKALEAELSKITVYQALEVIDRVRERLVATSKSCHYDDTVKPLSVKQKKTKSPEQAKRLRDRQRHSRQKTRMAKTALKLGANSDSFPKTLDTAPETLIETPSGNELSHVAADEAIAIQVQEDNESSCFCDVGRMTPDGQRDQRILGLLNKLQNSQQQMKSSLQRIRDGWNTLEQAVSAI